MFRFIALAIIIGAVSADPTTLFGSTGLHAGLAGYYPNGFGVTGLANPLAYNAAINPFGINGFYGNGFNGYGSWNPYGLVGHQGYFGGLIPGGNGFLPSTASRGVVPAGYYKK